jgi:hypothetical protein
MEQDKGEGVGSGEEESQRRPLSDEADQYHQKDHRCLRGLSENGRFYFL